MRESQYRLLRQELQKKIDLSAGKIQRWTRGILKRHQYLRMRKAAVTIQVRIFEVVLLNIMWNSFFINVCANS